MQSTADELEKLDIGPLYLKDLEELTIAQLTALKNAAEFLIERKREDAKIAFRDELEQKAREIGISVSELLSALPNAGKHTAVAATKLARSKPAGGEPKYRNPDNHSEVWGGRGKRPKWLKEKMDGGARLEDFDASKTP